VELSVLGSKSFPRESVGQLPIGLHPQSIAPRRTLRGWDGTTLSALEPYRTNLLDTSWAKLL
jgi:hypothetical protein